MLFPNPPAEHPIPNSIKRRGFSLIELMVVLAIIGILGMIALPQYQRFAAKSKIAGALSELAGGKPGVEAIIAEGFTGLAVPSIEQIGLPQTGEHCQRFGSSTTGSGLSITCYIKPDRYLGTSASMRLDRDAFTREWKCATTIMDDDLLPEMCRRYRP